MGWIYQIKNLNNGKCYVGQTTCDDVRKRWSAERSRPHGVLKYAFKRYGIKSFEFSKIVEIPRTVENFKEMLAEREILEIRERNTLVPYGYNLEEGGNVHTHHPHTRQKIGDAHRGKVVTQETREKLRISHLDQRPTPESIEKNRQAQIGKIISPATRLKISKANKNKKRSPETIEKIRQANLGRKQTPEEIQKRAEKLTGLKRTEETKEKMREAATGRKHTDETKQKLRSINTGKLSQNAKQVEQYTRDDIFIRSFRTISEAANEMNCSVASISNCCNGKTKSASKFKWKFA
jgi:group I intron endonuclease